MFCKTYSAAVFGIEAVTVQVEADVRNGLPIWQMVGALASEAKEAKERVRVAIENSGFQLPPKHITINISPADIRKEGTSFDLAIAISLLAAFGLIPHEMLSNYMFTGELSLNGTLNKVNGVLPMACLACEEQFKEMIVPYENKKEACVLSNLMVHGMHTLLDVVNFLNGKESNQREQSGQIGVSIQGINMQEPSFSTTKQHEFLEQTAIQKHKKDKNCDFADILGHSAAKRAMMIAAAGGHHLLLIGPPGSGKTALANCMASILPEMNFSEQLEVSKIHSVSGTLNKEDGLIKSRPFLAPHHTTTATTLAGGGRCSKPGVISQCHHGVLFLDEFPEFKKEVLETLREPLEEHKITVSRLYGTYQYPASFQLVAAMNPCLCGNYPNMERCRCTVNQIKQYIGRVSQPILDRIDITIEVFPVDYVTLKNQQKEESSEHIRKKVVKARELQRKRYHRNTACTNAEMTKKDMENYCSLGTEEEELLKKLFEENEFSTRGYYRLLKLARTIADLEEEEKIQKHHLIEAFSYRNLGKKYWKL